VDELAVIYIPGRFPPPRFNLPVRGRLEMELRWRARSLVTPVRLAREVLLTSEDSTWGPWHHASV